MLKIDLQKVDYCPNTKIEFSNNINRIPFSITIGKHSSLPSTIYSRNIHGDNFIEFRFVKEKHNLYEISLVAIQKDSVIEKLSCSTQIFDNKEFYVCNIYEEESLLEDFLPMKIERYSNSVHINLIDNSPTLIKYFSIGNNCSLGVSPEFYLSAINLHGLNKENIFNIFGY